MDVTGSMTINLGGSVTAFEGHLLGTGQPSCTDGSPLREQTVGLDGPGVRFSRVLLIILMRKHFHGKFSGPHISL